MQQDATFTQRIAGGRFGRLALLAVVTVAVCSPGPATARTGPDATSTQGASTTQSVDFSGVDAFWRVADQLLRDVDPPESQWGALFATPGYAALEERERRRAALTAGFRAAFMPSRRVERDELLAKNDWVARVIRHVQPLPESRAAIDAFRRKVELEDPVGAAIERVRMLLPEGTVERYGRPPVAFVFFLPDGRGYPGLIVADLAHLAEKPDVVPFLAHESFHFFHGQIARSGSVPATRSDEGARRLLGLLTKIEEEAIADQFDKHDIVALDQAGLAALHAAEPQWLEYLEEYRVEFAQAELRFQSLNQRLEAMAADPAALATLAAAAAKELPLEGRPLGMYLTQAIRRVLGDARLAGVVADPVGFFAAYQEAALKPQCRCPRFSSEAMQVVLGLRAATSDS